MAIVSKALVLEFTTSLATIVTVKINNPSEVLTDANVKNAMDDIITNNALGEVDGVDLEAIKGAYYAYVKENELSVSGY